MMSGRREPIRRSLISMCLAKEVSHDALWFRESFRVGTGLEESREAPATLYCLVLEKCLPVTAPDKSTAAPRVIPVCPKTSILL